MARKPKTPRWLEAARRRQEPVPEGSRADWLARALGRAGVLPREEAEQAIREGRVEVDGRVEREPFAPVHAELSRWAATWEIDDTRHQGGFWFDRALRPTALLPNTDLDPARITILQAEVLKTLIDATSTLTLTCTTGADYDVWMGFGNHAASGQRNKMRRQMGSVLYRELLKR